MINALNGFLVSIDQNSLVINVSGVEFYVEISTQAASYFSSLNRDKEVRVLTKYVVREDAALLFGFKDSFERDCFNQLQTVPGIGAKSAQKLILMLRDTLVITDDSPSGVDNVEKDNKLWADVVDSLVGMGFDKKNVYKTLDKILKEENEKIKKLSHTQAESYIFPILLRRLS